MLHRYDEEIARQRVIREAQDARRIGYQLAKSMCIHVLKNRTAGAIANDDIDREAVRGALELCLDAICDITWGDTETIARCKARMAQGDLR